MTTALDFLYNGEMNVNIDKNKIYVPPLKIQGIKTKLIPVISENIKLNKDTVWIEPFMGSGVVGFNIAPKKAIFCDTNPYIIQFYNDLKNEIVSSEIIRKYLEIASVKLQNGGTDYYYEVRNRFNKEHSSLDFLFLNRSCFNGLMRFNSKGDFNVPFCHKPNRFSKAYITKIVHQVEHIEKQIKDKDWTFVCQSFEDTISAALNIENAFIYCDPPYIGRNVDYFGGWTEEDEKRLKDVLLLSKKNFMISTWDYNEYRKNEYISTLWKDCNKINIPHFYHVGAKEKNRVAMMEALLMNYKIC